MFLTPKVESFSFGRSDAPSPLPPSTPVSRQKELERLQEDLKILENKLSTNESGDTSKLIVNIDQIKNKIATLRGQKALFESNRSSRLLTNIMKTMEKEVSYEENRRKQHIEKITKKNFNTHEANKNFSSINLESARRFLFTDSPTPRFAEDSKVISLIKENLAKREKELVLREQALQETWMKIPGAKELIENVNLTLSKLTEQKDELDREREFFEKEKVEIIDRHI